MSYTGRLGRTHFSLDRQIAFIQGHGTQVVVFPVLQCPCLRAERQFDPLCASCHGTGRYYPPHTAYPTMLLLHQEDSQREFHDPGTWLTGTIRATVMPGIRLCERDKIQWADIKDVFTDETLVKGIDDVVRFSAGVEILLVADREQVYRPGVDYILTPPNTLSWVSGGQSPAFMAQYAVKYEAFPEFLVVNDIPRLRVEHRLPQSQEVILMRLDKIQEAS